MLFYKKFEPLLHLGDGRYDAFALTGGRGSMKTGHACRAVMVEMMRRKVRVVCFRETKTSQKSSLINEFQELIEGEFKGRGFKYNSESVLNGLTGGGLDYLGDRYGIDTRMEDYLDFKDEEGTGNLTRQLGNMAQLGGLGMSAYSLGRTGTNVIRPHYNSWQIGRAYDRLSKKTYQGSGQDIIARMKNHNGETVLLQRGEAIPGQNGEVITSGGKAFQRLTGTKSNYGLNKLIYKHKVPKEQAAKIPEIIKQKPSETNKFGQNVYLYKTQDGDVRVITSPKDEGRILSSMYEVGL